MTLPRHHPAHPRPLAVHLDTDGRPRCNHPRACRLTAELAEVTCGVCLMRLAGLTSTSGLRHPDWQLAPHGTAAAYKRHYRRGEDPCESCKQGQSRRHADYRVRRAA